MHELRSGCAATASGTPPAGNVKKVRTPTTHRRASRSSFVLSMPNLICGNWIGDHTRSSPFRSGSFQDAKLLKRGHPVVEANFLCDLAVLDAEHGCAREPHLPARCECEQLELALATNLVGPFRLSRALLGALSASVRQGRGTVILNIISDAAINPYPQWGVYGASKAALLHLSWIWDAE